MLYFFKQTQNCAIPFFFNYYLFYASYLNYSQLYKYIKVKICHTRYTQENRMHFSNHDLFSWKHKHDGKIRNRFCVQICVQERNGFDFTAKACWAVHQFSAPRSVFPPHDKFLDFLTTHSWCVIGHGLYVVLHALTVRVWEVSDCSSANVRTKGRRRTKSGILGYFHNHTEKWLVLSIMFVFLLLHK